MLLLLILILKITITTTYQFLLQKIKQQLSEKYFKVKMYRRGGVPSFCGISHFKLISEKELPVFIRSTSLLASIFANVWHGSKMFGLKELNN